ncbi:GD15645 [Drosophila simulans]|uniref:GD15645 n=1 Tax=Drosophila simulans TaxID=7240 RepID=B4R6Y3_DROSI|nr:GD15645 [Drosophila simulans]
MMRLHRTCPPPLLLSLLQRAAEVWGGRTRAFGSPRLLSAAVAAAARLAESRSFSCSSSSLLAAHILASNRVVSCESCESCESSASASQDSLLFGQQRDNKLNSARAQLPTTIINWPRAPGANPSL